jgi:hypothetical protein
MELRPLDLSEHEEGQQPAEEARGGWVEEALGDRWKSDGDGIYRHVPEPDAPTSPRLKPDAAALTWTLACGHKVPVLPHERPDVALPRPRMCLKCGRLRKVSVEQE